MPHELRNGRPRGGRAAIEGNIVPERSGWATALESLLEELGEIQIADVVLPTVDGRELRVR